MATTGTENPVRGKSADDDVEAALVDHAARPHVDGGGLLFERCERGLFGGGDQLPLAQDRPLGRVHRAVD